MLSLVRCPSGTSAKCFFAKHAWAGPDDDVARVDVGEKEPMLAIDDLDGLIELVQAGVLEIHPWGSTRRRPGAARPADLRSRSRARMCLERRHRRRRWRCATGSTALGSAKLRQDVRRQGPARRRADRSRGADWDAAKAFTRAVAEAMAKDAPDRYVATMSKRARRGRIFVDYLRNGRGATAVAAYSTRALPQAPVSTPLDWDELSEARFARTTSQSATCAQRLDS